MNKYKLDQNWSKTNIEDIKEDIIQVCSSLGLLHVSRLLGLQRGLLEQRLPLRQHLHVLLSLKNGLQLIKCSNSKEMNIILISLLVTMDPSSARGLPASDSEMLPLRQGLLPQPRHPLQELLGCWI